MTLPRDCRAFSQRATLQEMKGCFAINRDDTLVVVVEWEKTTYWGGKVLRVRDASEGGGCKLSWEELDEHLIPAFPQDPRWLENAHALRAQFNAEMMEKSTTRAARSGPTPRL